MIINLNKVLKVKDQEADKDPTTVAREQLAENAKKQRSQFVYSLAIGQNATAD